jgi:tetratricopeptide (TPR) repeat protein
MTNDWAMIGFFPLFMVALVWLRGLAFFNVRFLGRMFLLGLTGLSLYLLLPIVQSLAEISHLPFWLTLKTNLLFEKNLVTSLPFNRHVVFSGDSPLWILALTSLLPVLVISIRWPSYFGDPSKLGVALATSIFHVFHGVLLLVCAWVALDPRFSPRHHPLLSAYGVPGLPLYYLGALGLGYFAGYFLLIFGKKPSSPRTLAPIMRTVNPVVSAVVWAVLVVTPLALIYRNLPQIRVTNGPLLKTYAASQEQAMVDKKIVALSDDLRRLRLAQAFAAQTGRSQDLLFLETGSLKYPDYQRWLKQRYPDRWQNDPGKDRMQAFDDVEVLSTVAKLGENNAIWYLHHSFGYYFEVSYAEPHGMAYKLMVYPTNSVFPPPPTRELIDENEKFWANADKEVLTPLLTAIAPPPIRNPGPIEKLMKSAHLTKEPNPNLLPLGPFYSRALDFWGVEMQRTNLLPQAAAHFERAFELNPDNVVAKVNLEFNRNLQAGRKSSAEISKSIEDQFGKYRSWEQVLNDNGPFDEPNFCYPQGQVFVRGRNYRQAAEEFQRVKMLAPDNLQARLWLAQLYMLNRVPERAIAEVQEIHASSDLLNLGQTNQTELLKVEAAAYLSRNDLPNAESAIRTVLRRYPNDEELLAAAAQTYMDYRIYSNALSIIDQQLKLKPDNVNALVNKGFASLQVSACDQAIPALSHALELQTNNSLALYNRAIAYLQCGQLDAAQRDYEALQKAYPTFHKTYYGLGEIAYRRKDTNAAIRSYELYLTNAPPGTEEAKTVSARLSELLHPGSASRSPAFQK